MQFDLTITISIILGVSAIIAPIFVALINNKHHTKIKKLELASDKMIEAFEQYIEAVLSLIKNPEKHRIDFYSHKFSTAVLYASPKALDMMLKIDDYVKAGRFDQITNDHIKELSKQMQICIGIFKKH